MQRTWTIPRATPSTVPAPPCRLCGFQELDRDKVRRFCEGCGGILAPLLSLDQWAEAEFVHSEVSVSYAVDLADPTRRPSHWRAVNLARTSACTHPHDTRESAAACAAEKNARK